MSADGKGGESPVWSMRVTGGRRIDWRAERDRIDLAAVVTRLLGPAPGRRGERGAKLWWSCPLKTHEDRNPSFVVEPGKAWWKCWGCGDSGDAASLVMRVEGKTFPEALEFLSGGPFPPARGKAPRPTGSPPEPAPRAPAGPSGLSEADALALVEAASARLWSPEGAAALAYLTGPERCLAPQTVRTARLGLSTWETIPKADGTTFRAVGVVVPWFASGRLALVKIRQPDDRRPKYVEAFRDPSRLVCYPNPETIRPGLPLIIVEGELDALCLGQELADLAAVVTLGSASARPDARALSLMLASPRWFISTDRDPAGDKAAEGWPPRARRVRPPEPFKDWTDARGGGVNLRRWWSETLAGNSHPALFAWPELAALRWGPGLTDQTPGIDSRGRYPVPMTSADSSSATLANAQSKP